MNITRDKVTVSVLVRTEACDLFPPITVSQNVIGVFYYENEAKASLAYHKREILNESENHIDGSTSLYVFYEDDYIVEIRDKKWEKYTIKFEIFRKEIW